MTHLRLELLILTVLLIYFGVFMTQCIYRKYEKPIYAKQFYLELKKRIINSEVCGLRGNRKQEQKV